MLDYMEDIFMQSKVTVNKTLWDAFKMSGKPGYFLLYKALEDISSDTRD
jgi:hypothetical protein